ncbi:MAG: hypothetical protein QF578_22750 [Alphaproteobacteria bacterium]|nr:hypothetical protein [Alphaproteobacteria bacterium]MDP6813199.1 hypothetical protein [Alphaproteobacteria bacterium]
MGYSLEQYCEDCRAALAADGGAAGREAVRANLERLLQDGDFLAAHLGPDQAVGTRTLYQDPDHEFCVLAYVTDEARTSMPHDHGASWAIYGQATGQTDITEYRRNDGGAGAGAAQLEQTEAYRLEPGKAGLYDVGDIHAIDYPGGARFVRVTGTDLNLVPRLRFDPARGVAETIENASVPDPDGN